MKYLMLFTTLIFLITGCDSTREEEKQGTPQQEETEKPNIILMIGDGMGLSQISYGIIRSDQPTNFERFKHIGLMKTSSAKEKITDSAAGATAFSCGIKTYNGAIGVDTDTLKVDNIVEILSEKGYSSGIISTSSVTHATPASFYAHKKHRHMEEAIALDLTTSEIDYFSGGGLDFFINRTDSINAWKNLKNNGFTMDSIGFKEKVLSPEKKYGFLLSKGGMPTMEEGRSNYLSKATVECLQYLSAKETPFFMMVEGSQIDWGGHANDSSYVLKELFDFDEAVGEALNFAETNENTIVIVLADHETGGLALAEKDGSYEHITPVFASKGHTATLIPVFAFGNNAELFSGIFENTAIFDKILEISKK